MHKRNKGQNKVSNIRSIKVNTTAKEVKKHIELRDRFQGIKTKFMVFFVTVIALAIASEICGARFKGFFAFLMLGWTIFCIVYAFRKIIKRFTMKKQPPTREELLEDRLKETLINNQIITFDKKIETDDLGRQYEVSVPKYIPQAKIKFENEYLYFSFSISGSLPQAINDKLKNLEEILTDEFSDYYFMSKKKNQSGDYIYIFSIHKPKRLDISSSNDIQNSIVGNINIGFGKTWNYRKNPHALICGGTGSGKSYFLFFLIKSFLKQKADIYIIDPKQSDLSTLGKISNDIPNENVATTPGQACQILRNLVEKMEDIYKEMSDNPLTLGADFVDYHKNPTVLIVDELASLVILMSKSEKEEFNSRIKNLILKGRQAGIQVVLTSQRGDISNLGGGDIRDSLFLRVALGSMSKDGYRMMFSDIDNISMFDLDKGQGYVTVNGISSPSYYESPFIKIKDMALFMNE